MATRWFHGTRTPLEPGEFIAPAQGHDGTAGDVHLTLNLDEAIWDAESDPGEGPGRVYAVEPSGEVEAMVGSPLPRPTMSHRSRAPLRIVGEVTDWLLYHGTRADLKTGDLIEPGHTANFGERPRTANHVYMSRTLDAATWGAELALGEAPGRIYIVEPTGPIEDDPNLTNKKFRGNPTKSFRSRAPLRVVGEVADWKGHAPEAVQAMKDGLERLRQLGNEVIDD
jgi:rifampin ADP-ribosylating transferase